MNKSRIRPYQRGVSMVELVIALPMFLMLIFVIAEMSLMHQAKSVLDMASLAAARAGAINQGDPARMKTAAAAAMSPLYAPGTNLAGAIGASTADAHALHAVGSTRITHVPSGPNFNDAGGGSQPGIKVEILSPTRQMVKDFGVSRSYGEARPRTERVIPNDNLMYRDTREINGVNVQDANLLKIRVTYLYQTRMPMTKYFFTPLMNASLMSVMFGGEAIGNTADAPGGDGWRVPLVSYATVRMQSDFKEASLSAAVDGTSGTGWEGKPGTPGDPGNPAGLDDFDGPEGDSAVTTVPESDEAKRIRERVDKDPLQEPAVKALVDKLPTLRDALTQLRYGQDGGVKIVYWARKYSTGTNELVEISAHAGNEFGVVQHLSHEIGHALYIDSHGGRIYDTSSKENYIKSYLENEAAAVIMNIKVRQEVLDVTKREQGWELDIGIIGAGVHSKQEYLDTYNKYKDDEATALAEIGKLFGDERHPSSGLTYRQKAEEEAQARFGG